MKNIFTHRRDRDNAFKTTKNVLVSDPLTRTMRAHALQINDGVLLEKTLRTAYKEGKSGMIDIGAMFSDDNEERRGRKTYRQVGRY